MQPSSPKTGRRAALLLPAACAALLLLPLRAPSSAFTAACAATGASPASSATPRRLAIGGLLLPAVAAPAAQAAEDARAVVRPQFSFQLPSDMKDWVMDTKVPATEAVFDRKDGAFIAVGPCPVGYIDARFKFEAGPGNGFRLEKYAKGTDQDVLEWTKLATIYRGAQGGGPMPGGFLFQDGDWTSYHSWLKVLHGPRGDMLMSVAILQDKVADEGAAMREVLDSFRLVEA